MSDLGTRARALATRQGDLTGDKIEQRVGTWLRLQVSQSEVIPFLRLDVQPPAKALGSVLFDLTVLCALWGIDIVDAISAAVDQRELGLRKPVAGTLAPVPNAETNDGTLRDPATKEAKPLA